jgi:hypothetical protein
VSTNWERHGKASLPALAQGRDGSFAQLVEDLVKAEKKISDRAAPIDGVVQQQMES